MKFNAEVEVYLWQGAMDMWRSFDALAQFVREQIKVPLMSGAVFVFFSRCRSKVKLLYWDRDGYAILFVNEYIRPRFACSGCKSGVVQAPTVNKPLPKSIAGAALCP